MFSILKWHLDHFGDLELKIGLKIANFLQNSDQIRVWHGENVFLARRARAVPCRPARRTDARQAATLQKTSKNLKKPQKTL